ncbi:MAG: sugar phosphate nucleotidyltransferase, partial [Planctomycetota bacterium]
GTGHAVMMARDALANHNGPVIVVAGDSPLLQADSLRTLLEHFDHHRPALLLGSLVVEDATGLGRIVRDTDGKFSGIVEHKDATPQQQEIREVNMSTYVFNGPDLLWALDHLSSDNAQNEYYITDCASLLHRDGRSVDALPVLKPCESLSINDRDQLAIVDAEMRKMGYAR